MTTIKNIRNFINVINGLVCKGLDDNEIMSQLYQEDFIISYMGEMCRIPWGPEEIDLLVDFLERFIEEVGDLYE